MSAVAVAQPDDAVAVARAASAAWRFRIRRRPWQIDGVLDDPIWRAALALAADDRNVPAREPDAGGRDHGLPRRERRPAPDRVRCARSGPGVDPRLSARPRLGVQRRFRRRRARHLQRSTPRVRVLRQCVRRADGPDPGRRQPQRELVVERDLGLGRRDQRAAVSRSRSRSRSASCASRARTASRRWGIDVLRFRPRAQRVRISNNPQDRNRNCYLCQFGKFTGFANAEPGKALEVVPTLTATRTDSRATPGVGPARARRLRDRGRARRALGHHPRL